MKEREMQQCKSTSKWRKRSPTSPLPSNFPKPFLFALILALIVFSFLFFSYSPRSLLWIPLPFPPSSSPAKSRHTRFPQCTRNHPLAPSRFLFYAPHSGFSNQMSEFRNAILMAAILNRTLIVPPVLDHHAVALGSCPKFRVSNPNDLRGQVLDHIVELITSRRYVAMTDIVDLSSVLSSSMVKIIDFRVFASAWCGLNTDFACSWRSLSENVKQCRSLLSGLEGNIQNCIYAVQDDCRTTVWTYKQNDDGELDSFQPDNELRRRKKISYIRVHRDVAISLGPESEAERATLLSFGTLFSAPYRASSSYIDIKVPNDPQIQSLLQKIEFLPFVPEIIRAGKNYVTEKIKEPFLCAQLRLLDGQFKNHWKTTFSLLKQKLQALQLENKRNKADGPINIFVMTDLPSANWTGSYLDDLASKPSSFKLHMLQEGDSILLQTAKNVRAAEHGLRSSSLSARLNMSSKNDKNCYLLLPDISLYLEETICSCASLGFVGTSGSTIAEAIELMRKNDICKT